MYRDGVNLVELQMVGDRVDMLYMLRGQPSGYDSTSDEEHEEAPDIAVVPRIQYFIQRDKSESLIITTRRLNQCGQTNAQGGVDSSRSSGF
jgi:hypothetical protein